MHPIPSHPPVVRAVWGMLPSVGFFGRRVRFGSVRAVFVHCVTRGIVVSRRHFPSCRTSGIFVPTGTLLRTKLTWAQLSAVVVGSPGATTPQWSQDRPASTGASGALGT